MGVFKSKGVSTAPFNIYLGIAAFFGAIIGAYIAVDVKGETFNKILAGIMVAVVLIIIFKPKMKLAEMQERITGKYLWIGMFGFFFVRYLWRIYKCRARVYNYPIFALYKPHDLGAIECH